MAKFTSTAPLNLRWFGNEISGAAGATHRIPDALYDEFNGAYAGLIPGLTWITQDEASAVSGFDPATKYDKTGGTISGAVTVTGALVAQSTVSVVGTATLGSVIASAVTATTARFKGGPWVDVRAYGATGNGTTDDLAAFNAAATALVALGGGTIYVPTGSYYLSNEWNIDVDSVHLEMAAGATVFTTAPTTSGHTIGFIGGGVGLGAATSPQNTWASMRGGTVYNTGNSTSDNAIGFVRYKNARCEGVRVTICGRKAITAQAGVDRVRFINNSIGTTGMGGITVELTCTDARVEGNSISQCGTGQLDVEAAAGIWIYSGITNASITGNTILTAGSFGIRSSGTTNLHIEGNSFMSCASNAVSIVTATRVRVVRNLLSSGKIGVALTSVGGQGLVSGNYISAGSLASNTYDAIYFDASIRPTVEGNVVAGTTHRHVQFAANMSGLQAVSFGNIFTTGGTTAYGGNVPVHVHDLLDGFPVVAANPTPSIKRWGQGTAAPASGTWSVGDIVWNTAPAAGGTPGWVCTTAGTPGTWKAMAAVAA